MQLLSDYSFVLITLSNLSLSNAVSAATLEQSGINDQTRKNFVGLSLLCRYGGEWLRLFKFLLRSSLIGFALAILWE